VKTTVGLIGADEKAVEWAFRLRRPDVELLIFATEPVQAAALAEAAVGTSVDSIDAMLAQRPPVVIVAGGSPTIADAVLKVFACDPEALRTLVVEPTWSPPSSDPASLVEAAHAAGVAMYQPFHKLLAAEAVLEQIVAGAFGAVCHVHYRWSHRTLVSAAAQRAARSDALALFERLTNWCAPGRVRLRPVEGGEVLTVGMGDLAGTAFLAVDPDLAVDKVEDVIVFCRDAIVTWSHGDVGSRSKVSRYAGGHEWHTPTEGPAVLSPSDAWANEVERLLLQVPPPFPSHAGLRVLANEWAAVSSLESRSYVPVDATD
jgi:hypothetical protein